MNQGRGLKRDDVEPLQSLDQLISTRNGLYAVSGNGL
jgi:hypothetical protein